MIYGLMALALATPMTFPVQGALTDAGGQPMAGSRNVSFRLHDADSGGRLVHEELLTVSFQQGAFSVLLGAGGGLDAEDVLGPGGVAPASLWMSVELDGVVSPRVQVGWAPLAAHAAHAAVADHATQADHATNADNATNAGHATTADSATSAGTATSADNAVALGGRAASAYVTVDGVFPWNTVDKSQMPARVATGYTSGDGIVVGASSIAVDTTRIAALARGAVPDTESELRGVLDTVYASKATAIVDPGCATNQILRWNGAAWACAADPLLTADRTKLNALRVPFYQTFTVKDMNSTFVTIQPRFSQATDAAAFDFDSADDYGPAAWSADIPWTVPGGINVWTTPQSTQHNGRASVYWSVGVGTLPHPSPLPQTRIAVLQNCRGAYNQYQTTENPTPNYSQPRLFANQAALENFLIAGQSYDVTNYDDFGVLMENASLGTCVGTDTVRIINLGPNVIQVKGLWAVLHGTEKP